MDNEIKGEGNSYTTHYRQLDPRIGRWLTIDPKADALPWQSPYASMNNNPIGLHDPNGDIVPIVIYGVVFTATEVAVILGVVATAATIQVNKEAIKAKIQQVQFNMHHSGASITPGGFTPVTSEGLEIETFPAYSGAARGEIMQGVTPVIENTSGGFRGGMSKIPVELKSPNIETIPEFSEEVFGSLMLAITGSVTVEQAGGFIVTEEGAQSREALESVASKINSNDPWDKAKLESESIDTVIVDGKTFVLGGHNRLSGLVFNGKEGSTLNNVNNLSIEEAYEQYGDLVDQILSGEFETTVKENIQEYIED